MTYDHAMIDLETLGVRPGATILSIGVVPFDVQGPAPEAECLHLIISRGDSERLGFQEDVDTVAWWDRQSWEAQETLRQAEEGGFLVPEALAQLTAYLRARLPIDLKGRIAGGVWGNGSDFDNVMLAAAYHRLGQALPWPFWQNRCFRTLKGLGFAAEPRRQGTHHNALDDALHQARWAVAILRELHLLRGLPLADRA